MNGIRSWLKAQLPYLKDLGSRTVRAFFTAVLPLLGLGDDALDFVAVDWKGALLAGATAAGATLVKGVAARFVGSPTTASLRR